MKNACRDWRVQARLFLIRLSLPGLSGPALKGLARVYQHLGKHLGVTSEKDGLAALVLAAGFGVRLRPMTSLLPKALCPVNNVPLVDLALARAKRVTDDVAVNIHHGREEMEEHLAGRAHLSIETPEALGTAGALGNLRGWVDGRDVLVVNSDAWHEDDLKGLLAGWDRSTIRLLTVHDPIRGDFGDRRYCGAALIPWDEVSRLEAIPSGLY